MTVPEKAEELQKNLNEIAQTLSDSMELAEDKEIQSEAVMEALENANREIKTASEQLANVVGGN
jgi:predicted transcriptional regulator